MDLRRDPGSGPRELRQSCPRRREGPAPVYHVASPGKPRRGWPEPGPGRLEDRETVALDPSRSEVSRAARADFPEMGFLRPHTRPHMKRLKLCCVAECVLSPRLENAGSNPAIGIRRPRKAGLSCPHTRALPIGSGAERPVHAPFAPGSWPYIWSDQRCGGRPACAGRDGRPRGQRDRRLVPARKGSTVGS